jgi:TonB family protein
VGEDGKTLFLNFYGQYPGHLFNAVIFGKNVQAFPEARTWEGKTIRVRGKIQLYEDESIMQRIRAEGKPEIILERPEQVTIDSTSTPPQGAMPQGTEAAPGAVGSCLAGTDIAPVRDYDSPPRPEKIVHPQYLTWPFLHRAEGTVMVEILIDSEGRVARAHVIQSIPLLDGSALECVYQWTFHAAMKDGHPVPALVNAPIIFRREGHVLIEPQRKQRIPAPARAPGAE